MDEQDELIPSTNPHNISNNPIYYKRQYGQYAPEPMNYWTQFALFLGLAGGGLVVGSLVAVIIVKIMVPTANLFELDKVIMQPENANAAKVLQLVTTVFMFFLPAFFFALIVHKKPLAYLGFNKTISIQQIGLVILIAWAAIFVGSILGEWNEMIPIPKNWAAYFRKAEDQYAGQVEAMAKMKNIKDYFVALLVIALTPALVEELFFRGTMQQLLVSWFGNAWLGIIITSIVFSAIHMSYYGFLTRASLGVVLGLLYYYSKNIWLNILAHFLNNAIAVTSLYIFSLQGKPMKDALEDHFPTWLGLGGIVFLVALMINFKRKSEDLLAEKASF
ncbi:CPBP family intramembrane glutamic endopeptidase [Parasediminibacterium sp. JCM 36343]|uniref:CPBP family intramembrane glutamic endopeptidase n=1 Tax=Parasediminibacterium sp. JCM 36343 TaxID=3374279 RepID=UPI00397B9031